MIFLANSQVELDQSPELQPIDNIFFLSSLLKVVQDGVSHLFNQETLKSQQTEALKDLNKLLKLVIEQDKKYPTKLSLHSNYYRRHIMI